MPLTRWRNSFQGPLYRATLHITPAFSVLTFHHFYQVWLQQLYPMLAKAESPLAVSLYDYINDASALACLINLSLNPSEVRGANDPEYFQTFYQSDFPLSSSGLVVHHACRACLRVSLVDRECQKVVCEPLGRNYRVSMPLIAFRSRKNMKHLGGAA